MTPPLLGQDIHWVPAQYDVLPMSRIPGSVTERAAKVTEVHGDTVCLVAFNRTGLWFGEGIPHDPTGAEWTWHAADECPRDRGPQ